MRKSMGMGRLTSIKAHDDRYTGFTKIAGTLEGKGVETEVYERGTIQIIPQLTYKTSGDRNIYRSVHEALVNGRDKSRRICMISAQARLDDINKDVKSYLSEDDKLAEELQTLNDIISRELEEER